MKIVCDSCATKYSISDDKVRGKVFKIRCKKCSHIIVVRGNHDGAAAGQLPAAASEGGGWHLVVDGDQVGPLGDADVRGRLSRGEINGESFVWKDGFADWVKLSTVAEFADELPAGGQDSGHVSGHVSGRVGGHVVGHVSGHVGGGELMSESNGASAELSGPAVLSAASSANSGGLFGSISVAPAESKDSGPRPGGSGGFLAPSLGSDLGGGDLFSAQPAPRAASDDNGWSGGGGLSVAPASHDGGRIESLTAQRHENSVLFSLSNLQSLAAPGAAAKPTSTSSSPSHGSEGSGLIDIRAMAASTLGSSSEGRGVGDDLPSFGSFSPAAPVLLSLPTPSGPPKWIYAAIAVMVALVGVIAWMAVKILADKPAALVEAPLVAPAPVAAPPATAPAEPVAAAVPPSPPVPEDKLPPRESGNKTAEAAAPATAAKAASKKAGKKSTRVPQQIDSSGRPTAVGSAAPAVAPTPEPAPRAVKGSLDDLLDNALTNKRPPPKIKVDEDLRKPPAEPPASGTLSKSVVVAGMNSVKGKISECYNQYKVPGMVMVNVVIGKNGKVSSATATGKFAATPTGQCVERAVKSANFPPSDGLSTPYPFVLK